MSGNTHTPEIERAKREKRAAFQKEMDAYGLRVSSKVAVLSTSDPNTVVFVMQTKDYPLRGYGSHIKQLKAAGFWIFKWWKSETVKRKNKVITAQRPHFRVQQIIMVTIHDESGVKP